MSSSPPDDFYKAQPVPEKPGFPAEAPRTSGKAIASLICGIMTPFLCGIPGVIAMIVGFMSLSDIKSSGGKLKGTGLATGGIITAGIGFALLMMAVPVLLLLPAIGAAREAARRNGCLNNARQLGLGCANHESALKRFPVASDASAPLSGPDAAIPASTSDDGRAAGYSWLVKLSPFIEEQMLFDDIKQSSERFTLPAFDASISSDGQHPSQRRIFSFVCPSYTGDSIATATEYESGLGNVAVGNYVALPGTHIKADGTVDENGVIVSKWNNGDGQFKGNGLRNIGDGISKTIILCESKEERYGSWYDGQAAWVTALRTDVNENSLKQVNGFASAPKDSAALLFGGEDEPYFPAARYAGKEDRLWGPSSDHSGGVVMHVFADAHATSISPDVDPTVYMQMVTRNGGEPADPDDL